MSYKPSYEAGKWKVLCDRCGFTYKSDELKQEWTGLMVCDSCWEARHPVDFIKAPVGEKALPWTRGEATDQFVTVDYVASTVGVQDTTIPEGHNNGSL